MNELTVHVEGIGLVGPNMHSWPEARAILRGEGAYVPKPTQMPTLDVLPPAERRRIGAAVKLALATGLEAIRDAGVNGAELATVFSSTGGDCDNCHQILESLASPERAVSPTRFHNSVHNAPAGYWSIATQCMSPSTSLCAYDATFSAGLIEAASQAAASGKRCLLISFDTLYPEPLHALRPIQYALGLALVLNPVRSASARATLTIRPSLDCPTILDEPELEELRLSNPTARSLPLLQHLARESHGSVVIEYLDGYGLEIGVNI